MGIYSSSTALEISLRATARGFESHRLRQKITHTRRCVLFFRHGIWTVGFERPALRQQGKQYAGGMLLRPWENPFRLCQPEGSTHSAIYPA